jgi:hypothetical protein
MAATVQPVSGWLLRPRLLHSAWYLAEFQRLTERVVPPASILPGATASCCLGKPSSAAAHSQPDVAMHSSSKSDGKVCVSLSGREEAVVGSGLQHCQRNGNGSQTRHLDAVQRRDARQPALCQHQWCLQVAHSVHSGVAQSLTPSMSLIAAPAVLELGQVEAAASPPACLRYHELCSTLSVAHSWSRLNI